MDTGKCTIPYVAGITFLLGSNSSRGIGIGYRLGEGILIVQQEGAGAGAVSIGREHGPDKM